MPVAPQRRDAGYRFALEAPAIPGMREWWERYYRGLLRHDVDAVRRDLSFRYGAGPRWYQAVVDRSAIELRARPTLAGG